MRENFDISVKVNKVLNVIILGFLLILLRVWYLAVVQRDEFVQQSHKPQRRTGIEHVERATIRDRFNIPLALNRTQYNVAVRYADIRQVPRSEWVADAQGKRVRKLTRMEHIQKLAKLLAGELGLDPIAIEDTIHGKASLFPQTPFVIKEDITESQYYRLKMLEKQWAGIQTERVSKRFYPHGKLACDILGYMGAISQSEYMRIAGEIKELQDYIALRDEGEVAPLPKGFTNPLEVRERLRELQEKAYTINDLVGKSGIEAAYDEQLRGFCGKKTYEIDPKGNTLRELPGSRKAVGGQRLLLSISAELQEEAELLLTEQEFYRDIRDAGDVIHLDQPWIKGGAIVAMIPQTGEIVALASYPRIDPNDFIPTSDPQMKKQKQHSVLQWLENEAYIGEIWDGKRLFERERAKESKLYNETSFLTFERYMEAILPFNGTAYKAIQKISDVETAVALQRAFSAIWEKTNRPDPRDLINALYNGSEHTPTRGVQTVELKESFSERPLLDRFLTTTPFNTDKLLVLDLCRLFVRQEDFNDSLLEAMGKTSLQSYFEMRQAVSSLKAIFRAHEQEVFHKGSFQEWRKLSFKDFLKERRKEEKEKKQHSRPYTEYLEAMEKKLFKEFWEKNSRQRFHFFIQNGNHPLAEKIKGALSYLHTFHSFEELDRPLLGHYKALRHHQGVQYEKHLAAAFYPVIGYGYGRSQAFRQSCPQGSVFKLVVAYEALCERYRTLAERHSRLANLNPLTLVDDLQWTANPGSNSQILGYTLDGHPIKRLYKGGRLPRSSHPHIGKVDMISALEQSSNIYFSILAAEHISDPALLAKATKEMGFGEKTGIELPGEIRGVIPDDLSYNLTGLYSFAIGQHSLVATPLQTAVAISTIANAGAVVRPKIVQVVAGKEPAREEEHLFSASEFPYQENLGLVGIPFPLFTEALTHQESPSILYTPTEIQRNIFFPKEVRDMLLEGMDKVFTGDRGTARVGAISRLFQNPQTIKDFIDLKDQLVGKTGTAEIFYKPTIDAESQPYIQNHVSCAAISFNDDNKTEPELVVVVYLRFGDAGGKEAAPLTGRMVKKWREICAKHGSTGVLNF